VVQPSFVELEIELILAVEQVPLMMMMIMILLVWQPIGWITNKVHCKFQKKKK